MQIHQLSNQELETQLLHFVRQERKLLHLIILHIREVDKRKLYLEKARPSLYEYLVKDLGYSSSAAQRRIEAARLLKDIPVLADKIQAGSVNLSQIGELSRAIKQKEKEESLQVSSNVKQDLLLKIENKNTFETQRILSQELDLRLKPFEVKQVQKDESVHLQITLTKEQYAKLQECKDLAAHLLLKQNAGMDTSDVINVLMDQFIKDKTRNSKTDPTHLTSQAEPTPVFNTELVPKLITTSASAIQRSNKSLTPKTRKTVINAKQCCQYQDPRTQKICGSRFALEIEHIVPKWAQGDHQLENLTVLCSQHNKLIYRKQAQVRLL